MADELASLRATVAAQAMELEALREEVAELRPLAELELARQRLRDLFISALICTAQNGYAREVDPIVGLCKETWGEEALFDALKDLPHGPLVVKSYRLWSVEKCYDFHPFGMKRTRLMYASQKGDVPRVQWLLARGARTELVDSNNCTALHWASWHGHAGVVRALIERRASVDVHDCDFFTPLHLATLQGNVDVIRELVRVGSNLNETGWDGVRRAGSVLWNKGFCKMLDVCCPTLRILQMTPLCMARAEGNDDFFLALLEMGALRIDRVFITII